MQSMSCIAIALFRRVRARRTVVSEAREGGQGAKTDQGGPRTEHTAFRALFKQGASNGADLTISYYVTQFHVFHTRLCNYKTETK